MNNKIELLAPAADLTRGMMAINFGADAIYFGGKEFSLRMRASNFDLLEMNKMIDYAHSMNKKAYLVTNVVCRNHTLLNFNKFFTEIIKNPPDAFLCTDPAIIQKILAVNPKSVIHISTQQSVTNSKAALFWARNGAKRIVTAREVSKDELKLMIKNVQNKIEIEIFIHGAVCISYSGRCMLSSNFCLRDANNGGCAQSCRWINELSKDKQVLSKLFSMSPKDICLIKYIEDICQMGFSALKIEGRMKSEHYIATVVNAYRKAIDKIDVSTYEKDIQNAANRETSVGWFLNEPTENEMLYHDVQKNIKQLFAMIVKEKINDTTYVVVSKNYFKLTDTFTVLGQKLKHLQQIKLLEIKNENQELMGIVNTPMRELTIKINKPIDLQPLDILRIH